MFSRIKRLWWRLKVVDWAEVVLSLLKTVKKDAPTIEDRFIIVKPRILSDDNILRGVAALRVFLAFVPPAQVLGSVLSLGDMGFKIWKAIALRKEYNQLTIPPLGINTLGLFFQMDPILYTTFRNDLEQGNWGTLEKIWNDLSFITSHELLIYKYPNLPKTYLMEKAEINKRVLGQALDSLEQSIRKVRHAPEIDTNLQDAVGAVRELFPAMRNWALLNSKNFDSLVEIIDEVV